MEEKNKMKKEFSKRWRYALVLLCLLALAGMASAAVDISVEKKSVSFPSGLITGLADWNSLTPVTAGTTSGTVNYAIKVSNIADAATVVDVKDTLPSGLSTIHVYNAGTGGSLSTPLSTPNVQVTGNVVDIYPGSTPGSMTAGETDYYIIQATLPSSSGLIHNSVQVTEHETDIDTADNTATNDFYVGPKADMSVTKKSVDSTSTIADLAAWNSLTPITTHSAPYTIKYAIKVSNTGSASASNVHVVDTLPSGLTASSVLDGGTLAPLSVGGTSGTYAISGSPSGNIVDINVGTVTAGATNYYWITATIPTSPANNKLHNVVQVTETVADLNTADNLYTTDFYVGSAADMAVAKKSVDLTGVTFVDGTNWGSLTPVTTASPSGTVKYAIKVSNTGSADATNVHVVDTLPDGLAVTSITKGDLTTVVTDNNVAANIVDIIAGTAGTVTHGTTEYYVITATIPSTCPGSLANSVTVSTDSDIDSDNNAAMAQITVSSTTSTTDNLANVKIEKKVVSSSDYTPGNIINDAYWGAHSSIAQTLPGQTVYYVIKVKNTDVTTPTPSPNDGDLAYGIVLTDKLSPDLTGFRVYNEYGTDITSSVKISDDVLYIDSPDIEAPTGTDIGRRYFVIQATIPATTSPNTIYNSVIVRSSNDVDSTDNLASEKFYIPPMNNGAAQYTVINATESFTQLIENQTALLFSFEDLLHRVPNTPDERYQFVASFEQLLRTQTYLYTSLVDLMTGPSGSGWNSQMGKSDQDRLLGRYEDLLRRESFLYMSFEYAVKDAFQNGIDSNYHYTGHTLNARQEFAASFEDLLHRQVPLLHTFETLEKRKTYTTHAADVAFLASFEDLLRLETNLLLSFEDVIKSTFAYAPPFFSPEPHTGTPSIIVGGNATASANATALANATAPTNATNAINATIPINATKVTNATMPINATTAINATMPVNATAAAIAAPATNMTAAK